MQHSKRKQHLSRREALKRAAALGAGAAFMRLSKLSAADAPVVVTDSKTGSAPKYNVLFLMADDMRPELNPFGNTLVHTPNLTALAAAGVMFERGYCQYPLCCPARSSMLTGQQVINTGVYGNRTWFGDLHPEYVSLPKWFKQQGYATLRTGKIFHGGIDDTEAWTEGGEARSLAGTGAGDSDAASSAPARKAGAAPLSEIAKENRALASNVVDGQRMTPAQYSDRTIVLEGDGEGHGDYACADQAIDYLRRYKDQAFFIGCGFVKPHSPPTAPQRFYDMIDMEKLQLPVDFASHRTLPEGFPEGCLRPKNADLFIGRDATPEEAKKVTQAYLASVSWTDWNIGRVIAELDKLGLREKTIIVFSADHGYQLGEKGKWSKAGSLWEEGARVPMFFAAPQAKGNGQKCERVVQALNIYPTLMELCGLPPPPQGLEGISMVPLLNDPTATWDHPAYTVWSENGQTLTGIGVRVEGWRYAEYDLGGAMLLDMTNDPHQLKNLAHDPKYAETAAKMAALVQKYRDSAKKPVASAA
jgi:arylsulfatase A-like enzyme